MSTPKKEETCVFSADIFNLYSKRVWRKLKNFPRFIISRCNHNTICYVDDTVLTTDSEGKLKEPLDRVIEESKKDEPLRWNACLPVKGTAQGVIYGVIKIEAGAEILNYQDSLIMGNRKYDRNQKVCWNRKKYISD